MTDASSAIDKPAPVRRIWLCADDYGISPAVSDAIRKLVALGRLNATSVMVAAPSFDRSEALALAEVATGARRAAIGLHLTLTAPFRPLSAGFRPQTSAGTFLPVNPMMLRGLLRRLEPQTLAAEVAAQMNAFITAFDRAPDFVDGHHHVHLLPDVGEAVLRIIRDAAPNAWARQCARARPRVSPMSDPKGAILDRMSARFRARAAELGVHTNAAFAGTYAFRTNAVFADLFPTFLDGLPDGGLVMCHPGFIDAELSGLDSLTDLRVKEYDFLCSEAFSALLASRGVALA